MTHATTMQTETMPWTEAQKRAYIDHHLSCPEPEAIPLPPKPEREVYVTEDGMTVDAETGEILGVATPPEVEADRDSENLALWILERLQRRDAEIKSAERLSHEAGATLDAVWKEYLDQYENDPRTIAQAARQRNAGAMLQKATREREGILNRFSETLKAVATAKTRGKRSRTWATVFGSLSLRKKSATIEIDDMEKAVALAEALDLHAAVRKSVNKSDLKAKVLDAYAAPDEDDLEGRSATDGLLQIVMAHPGAVSIVPERDELTVTTGV